MARSRMTRGHGHLPGPEVYSSECRGKICYSSKKQATGALRVMLAHGRGGKTLGAYNCSVCRRWHLGNSTRRSVA